MESFIIGIAGGTGSGKTTLTKRLKERFGDDVSVISHDNYYKRHDELPYEERCRLNYDHPDAFDTDLMVEQVSGAAPGRDDRLPGVRLYGAQPFRGHAAHCAHKRHHP